MAELFDKIGAGISELGRRARVVKGVEGQNQLAKLYEAERKAALSKERKMAMLQDAYQVNRLLSSGNVDAATMLVNDRLDNIKRLDGDTSHTQRLADMMYNGDINGAIAATQAVVEAGAAAGLLDLPKGGTKWSSVVTTEDGRRIGIDENNPSAGYQLISMPEGARVNRSGMNINMPPPAPPKGYRNVYDDNGNFIAQEVVPGGPVEAASEEQEAQTEVRGDRIGRLITTIRTGLDNPTFKVDDSTPRGAFFAGILRKGMSNAPGTPEYEFARNVDSLKANIAIGELQAMRQASPTGGAVGQLTDKEREAIGAMPGALDLGMRSGAIEDTLQQIEKETFLAVNGRPQDVIKAFKAGKISEPVYQQYQREYKSLFKSEGPPRVSTQAQYDKLPPGTEFIDAADGKVYKKPSE